MLYIFKKNGTNWKINCIEEPTTTTLGGPMQLEGESRNNVHLRPNLPCKHWVATSHNMIFDPLDLIEFIKDILVSNVWAFFQIWECRLPLNPTVILQGVSNEPLQSMCFLNGPLQSMQNHIVSLEPNTPQKTTPQEKLGATGLFQSVA